MANAIFSASKMNVSFVYSHHNVLLVAQTCRITRYSSARLFGAGRSDNKSRKISPSSERWLKRQRKDSYAKSARKEGLPSRAIFKLEQIDLKASSMRNSSSQKLGSKECHKAGSIFEEGQTVIDLGAAPGGWSVYASGKIAKTGTLISVDLLTIDPPTASAVKTASPQFYHIQGDFRSSVVKDEVARSLRAAQEPRAMFHELDRNEAKRGCIPKVDVVMSDMAANFTGDRMTDALRTMALCEDALTFAIGTIGFFADNVRDRDSQLSHAQNRLQDMGTLRIGGKFLCKFFSCGKKHEKDLMKAARQNFEDVHIIKPHASRRESSEHYLLATGFKGSYI